MKIAIINEYFYPVVIGGLELFMKALSEYLWGQGFELLLLTSKQSAPVDDFPFPTYLIKSSPFKIPFHHGAPGLTYYQFPGVTTPWMCFNRRLRKDIADLYHREKPDVIFANAVTHLSYAPLQAIDNIPVVTFAHDYFPVCFTRDFIRCNQEPYFNNNIYNCAYCLGAKLSPPRYAPYLAPFAAVMLLPTLLIEKKVREETLRGVDTYICDSNFVARVLGNHGYKAEVIPTPYLGEIGEFKKKDVKRKKTHNILFIGRVEWVKGAELLLDVARRLMGKIDFRIDIIGTGYKTPLLDRKDLNIHVHGFLEEERYDFLKKADCLIAPSIWPEPLGMVAQEAMAYQVPVVTLKQSGGLAELVKENGAGLLAEDESGLAGCILELHDRPNLVRQIRERAQTNIHKYEKTRTFERVKEVLIKAVESRH